MKIKTWLLMGAAVMACAPAPASAQGPISWLKNFTQDDGSTVQKAQAVTAANPLPITGTINASTTCTASTSAPTYTAGANPLSCDLAGALRIGGTINASSSTTATAAAPSYVEGSSTNAFSVNLAGDLRTIAKQSGTWTSTVTQATAASLNATVVGTGTFATQSTLQAGSALVGKVGIDQTTPGTTNAVATQALTTGGATPYHLITAGSTNSTLISTGAHTLYSLTLTGLNTTAGWLRLYDTASAPTCSSATGATHSYLVIGSATQQGGMIVPIPAQGEVYANGLSFCFTGGSADTDNTSGPSGVAINASYK